MSVICILVRKHVTTVTACFVEGLQLTEVGPVDLGRCAHRGPLQMTTSGLLTPWWKRLESINHTSDIWNSSKNRVPRWRTAQKRHLQLWSDWSSHPVDKWSETTEVDSSVCPVRHADRRILTVRGWLSRFRPYSTGVAANRKWCSRVPHVAGVIVDVLRLT